MSTKKEMLGKENRKENGHRRYSLLLLALLFIGFASYGTYAYFTSSTSTQQGHLTLNGMSQDYKVDDNGNNKFNDKSGDGTTNINDTNLDNDYKYVPGTDAEGNGKFEVVTGDEVDNSNKFGEFDWVYIGNASGVTIAKSEDLLKATQNLRAFNKYITSSKEDEGEDKVAIFNNVVGEDVFRKTVRLKVEGKATVPVKTTLNWAANDKDAGLENVIAGVFVKRGDVKKENETVKPEKEFSIDDGYTAAIKITEVTSPTEYTNEKISVKPGQYLDIEIVVMVRKDIAPKDAENLNLAKIARQLSVRLDQNISANDNTSVLGSR